MSDSRFSFVVTSSGLDDAVLATLTTTAASLDGRQFDCVVVANGVSIDVRRMASLPFEVTLLHTETTVSPGALLNSALTHTCRDFVAFLPAGAVPQRHWDAGAQAAFENSNVALVSARLLNAEGTIVRACGAEISSGRFRFVYGGAARDAIGVLRPTLLDLAPLCGSIIRRAHTGVVGGYDADFPESLFDFDWSLRAKAKGLVVLYRPDVTICYDGPLPFGRETFERPSALHFLQRWQHLAHPNLDPALFLP